MLPTDALDRLAVYANKVTGIVAHYPAPPTIKTPALVLFWDETTVSEMDQQTWLMVIKGHLMTADTGNPIGEIRKTDPLIAMIADAFSPNNADRSAYHLRSDSDPIGLDYCQFNRVIPSVIIPYAGHMYYGAELFWTIKLRRFAGEK